MKYVEAPEQFTKNYFASYILPNKTIFLAGGITDCPDWQQEMVRLLKHTDLTLFNPRQVNFPIHDPSAAKKQIGWEHEYLRKADSVLFWFCSETLNPIVLYELGAWSMTQKPLFVGVHPEYVRRQDVEIQTALTRPDIKIVYDLQNLARQVIEFS